MSKPLIGITVTDKPDDCAERYAAALEKAGAESVLLRPAGPAPDAKALDGLILSGGVNDIHPDRFGDPMDPKTFEPDLGRDRMEIDLLAEMRRLDKPVLGICRGFQLLNVAFGGRLAQHVDGHTSKEGVSGQHTLDVTPGSKLSRILKAYGPVGINSRHHQAVVPTMVAPRMRPTGYSPDGLVEAIESMDNSWIVGLQCHPERADEVDPRFADLFTDFVRQAGKSKG
ncbi:gamma-glutamyl-gamma-aminobutyrate hydrolase family protein [bacterium]|nr:gamma-glutamyl-gamma-aminobutyrate hydrolase family protein [bacterium]